jgi:hypothetical protein
VADPDPLATGEVTSGEDTITWLVEETMMLPSDPLWDVDPPFAIALYDS